MSFDNSPDTCTHWKPVRPMPSDPLICMSCGGVWTAHLLRPFGPSITPPMVAVRFPQRATATVLVAPLRVAAPSENMALTPVLIRRVMVPGSSRTTLGFGAQKIEDDQGTERWENVVAVIDADRVRAFGEQLESLTGAYGVDALVPDTRILARSDVHALYPAVYVGPTTVIEGMRPTLIEGQGVFVTNNGIRYDPTDPKAGEVQWPSRTLITDVPAHQLVSNANWRNWCGPHYPGWLSEPTFVASTLVPSPHP